MVPVTTDAKPKTADGGKAVASPLSAEELRKMDAYFRALNYYQAVEEKLIEHKHYIREHGDDMPEIAGWRWSSRDGAAAARFPLAPRPRATTCKRGKNS